MKIQEAASVYLPNPSTDKLNIPPHIKDVHRPHAAINIHFTGISFSLIVNVEDSGMKILINSNTMARLDTEIIWVRVEILPDNALEPARPTNIIIQYEAAIVPRIADEPFVKSVM